jgi:hypothetical protein
VRVSRGDGKILPMDAQIQELLRSLMDKGPQPIMRIQERLRKAGMAKGFVEMFDGPALAARTFDGRKRPQTIKYLRITDAGKAVLEKME